MANIFDEGEFLRRCEVAKGVIACAGDHEQIDGVRWFFRRCESDQEQRYRVVFRSWNRPRYRKFLLTVEAVKSRGGQWDIDVVKKVICGG